MMRILLPVILLLIGLGGGVAAGKMLSGGGTDAASDEGTGAPYGEDGSEAAAEDEYESGGDYGDASDPSSPYEYVRLNNQFIVPVIRHGSVRSLVVLSLTVEVRNGENTLVYDREPRLRDAFLRVMFSHANVGGFDGSFTTVEAMAPLRAGLREAAQQILGEIVNDVLIVDIVRQDV